MSLTMKDINKIKSKKVACDECGKKVIFKRLRKRGHQLVCDHCYFK